MIIDATVYENMGKPAISLSGGELADIIIAKLSGVEAPAKTLDTATIEDKWLKGIRAMAESIGVSKRYFQTLKSKGVFKKVIHQDCRTITAKETDLRAAWVAYCRGTK